MTARRYDVILVGGGHNGLVAAGYLARAGLDVLVLERRQVVGGPCSVVEYFPGYTAAMTNSPGSLEPRIVADMRLEDFGLAFTHPDPTPGGALPRRAHLRRLAREGAGGGGAAQILRARCPGL